MSCADASCTLSSPGTLAPSRQLCSMSAYVLFKFLFAWASKVAMASATLFAVGTARISDAFSHAESGACHAGRPFFDNSSFFSAVSWSAARPAPSPSSLPAAALPLACLLTFFLRGPSSCINSRYASAAAAACCAASSLARRCRLLRCGLVLDATCRAQGWRVGLACRLLRCGLVLDATCRAQGWRAEALHSQTRLLCNEHKLKPRIEARRSDGKRKARCCWKII